MPELDEDDIGIFGALWRAALVLLSIVAVSVSVKPAITETPKAHKEASITHDGSTSVISYDTCERQDNYIKFIDAKGLLIYEAYVRDGDTVILENDNKKKKGKEK